ncbi:hypothetical protein DICSQDRAFT_174882 [Dichomitus squalens LYAD-421 SS1]|uniref:Uncharacterized protein n=2 Tax=Dichomitus squalens TaxID=114155 RepID=A0A4Q9M644_9APHY|nr:uncharacterized protein DICSQDRAFT_174882 [Dichomitus squalens LYAD-421 SS1]EJF56431.1 hypothetical protein DICSQDRAFT_174882 [Dichomitus squalens LYAD-421 SS1]TBU21081.1 hypothetical protein BD311DRAFT_679415 [Dichomitus squalens]
MAARSLTYRRDLHAAMIEVRIRYSPRSKDFIREAVHAEVRARRVSLHNNETICKITLTPEGKRFYRKMGGSTLFNAQDKRLMRLTVKELREQTELIHRVVREIKHLFTHFHPESAPYPPNDIPGAMRLMFRHIDELNEQWTDLQRDLAADQATMRDLRAARRSSGHAGSASTGSGSMTSAFGGSGPVS